MVVTARDPPNTEDENDVLTCTEYQDYMGILKFNLTFVFSTATSSTVCFQNRRKDEKATS